MALALAEICLEVTWIALTYLYVSKANTKQEIIRMAFFRMNEVSS